MGLSENFWEILNRDPESEDALNRAALLLKEAPDGPEKDGLTALCLYNGWGMTRDLDKAFEAAERAALSNEGVALFLLGIMCENAETPDQQEGGPRQKYDHYDAEHFMQRCAATSSSWAEDAHLWLGHYFMNSARGGDPDEAIDHFAAIGHENADAAAALADYYRDMAEYSDYTDEEYNTKTYEWTQEAARLNPEDYSYEYAMLLLRGVGCEPSMQKAREYFEKDYGFGHWQGASALALLWEKYATRPGLSQEEADYCLRETTRWANISQDIRQSEKEADPAIDDD